MPLKFAASTTAGQLLASMLVNLIPDVFGATAPDAVGWGAPPMDAAAVDLPAPRTSAGGGGARRLGRGGRASAPGVRNSRGPRGKNPLRPHRHFIFPPNPPPPPQNRPTTHSRFN